MPRPDSGFLSGILHGIQQFKQTRQFYQQMETSDLQQERLRSGNEMARLRIGDYMGPQEQRAFDLEGIPLQAGAEADAFLATAGTRAEAGLVGKQAGIDFYSGQPAPETQPGQTTQYDPSTGQTGIVEDTDYGVIPNWQADKILEMNPGMEQFYTKEPVPGAGQNMVRLVKAQRRGYGSGYGSAGMEAGRLARALSGLGQMVGVIVSESNEAEKAAWDADRETREVYDDGQVFKGINPAALKQDSLAELAEQWLVEGIVSESKVKAYLDTDLKIFGPKSTNKLWLIALSNKNYKAFMDIRTTLRQLYESGMNEKQIDNYLVTTQAEYPGLEYQPYQTLQTQPPASPIQAERDKAVEQYGPLRTK